MTKSFPLLMIGSLMVFGSVAQTRGSLSISVGPSFPVGDFASKSGQNAGAGLANTGEAAALDYGLAFPRTALGIAGSVRYTANPIDAPATVLPFQQSVPGYEWSMGKSRWSSGALLVGGYYQPALTRRMDFRVNAEAGAALCYFPSILVMGVQYPSGGSTANLIQASLTGTHAISFAALAGVGLRYYWTRRATLLLEAEGAYADPTFRRVVGTMLYAEDLPVPGVISPGNARGAVIASNNTRRVTQSMNNIGVLLGLGYSW